jgi:hypothetical protein
MSTNSLAATIDCKPKNKNKKKMKRLLIFIFFLFLFLGLQSIVAANEFVDITIKGGRGIVVDMTCVDPDNFTGPWHLKEWHNLSFIFSMNPLYQEPYRHYFDEYEEFAGGASIFLPPRLAFGTFTVEISVSNSTAKDTAKATGFFFGRWTILNQVY